MKLCGRCGLVRSDFGRNRCSPDGLQRWCKQCRATHRRLMAGSQSEYYRWWRANNREKRRITNAAASLRRRATISGSQVTKFKSSLLVDLLSRGCVYCGAPSKHADHRIPLCRGGEHSLENLQPTCASCNLSKGSKTHEEFMKYISVA